MTIDPLLFTALILAVAVQAIIIALLSASMPAFVWRVFRLESRLDQVKKELDEVDAVVAEMNKVMMGPIGSKP